MTSNNVTQSSMGARLCPICLDKVVCEVNYCSDQHEGCCKECMRSYIESTLLASHHGSCPTIACPSSTHFISKKKRRIIYDLWRNDLPSELSEKYALLASSLLVFQCSGCHNLKSLDIGCETDKSGPCHNFLRHCLAKENKNFHDLESAVDLLTNGSIAIEEFYDSLFRSFFPDLASKNEEDVWEIFKRILQIVTDPERRANLHLRYLRDWPRIKTSCCSREHCFRCKTKDYHHGKTCLEVSASLDNSIVECPTCGISLAKGDGCNMMTCVCGEQFSWLTEKQIKENCIQFLRIFPSETSSHCVNLLCSSSSELAATAADIAKDGSTLSQEHLIQLSKAWQSKHRIEVSKTLYEWFRCSYWPFPAQSCVTLPLNNIPEGTREAIEIWRTRHPKEIEHYESENKLAVKSLFESLYPNEQERPVAAQRLLLASRLQHALGDRKQLLPQNTHELAKSAKIWINNNGAAYQRGIEEYEIRSAKQFLFLFGKLSPYYTTPNHTHCALAFEWSRQLSNQMLTMTSDRVTIERAGNVSCYPAAIAKLTDERTMIKVHIDSAPRTANWLSFGLAMHGFPNANSDGIGRSADSWGIADDRSNIRSLPCVAASGQTMCNFTRKFQEGDVLTGIVDIIDGWFEIIINDGDWSYRFEIPSSGYTKDDFVFAMTFANDHRASIIIDDIKPPSDDSSISSGVTTVATGGSSVIGGLRNCTVLNSEHSQMLMHFLKYVKKILTQPEENESQNLTKQLNDFVLPPCEWETVCGGKEAAAETFEMVKDELKVLLSNKCESWKKVPEFPWLTWRNILAAASWFRVNHVANRETECINLAIQFETEHGSNAPFMAAIRFYDYELNDRQNNDDDLSAPRAFMQVFPDLMHEWYSYDAMQPEPMLEFIAPGCRCLPRRLRYCSVCC